MGRCASVFARASFDSRSPVQRPDPGLVVCNVENDSGLSYRNEAGRPPPNLPLARGRDFQRYRFQCYSPLVLDLRLALPQISDNVIKLLGKLLIIANDPVEGLVLPDAPKALMSRAASKGR